MQTNAILMSPKNNVPARSIVCLGGEYDRILAFGKALKWEDESYEFVVARYREIVAVLDEDERIAAFAKALAWEGKPYEFVEAKYREIEAML